MLRASPIQNEAARPSRSLTPRSSAATGSTTYINESPMMTAAIGATANTIPAGIIAFKRIPRIRTASLAATGDAPVASSSGIMRTQVRVATPGGSADMIPERPRYGGTPGCSLLRLGRRTDRTSLAAGDTPYW